MWNTYSEEYLRQQQVQMIENQLMMEVSPRIIKAGWNSGVESVVQTILVAGGIELLRTGSIGSDRDPRAVMIEWGASFTVGFFWGAAKEVWYIIIETGYYQ